MRVLTTGLLIGLLTAGLSACGTSTGERALSGAGVGQLWAVQRLL